MGILGPRPGTLAALLSWADTVINTFGQDGAKVVMFIIPDVEQVGILNLTIRMPMPDDNQLRLTKTKKGITCYLRGVQVMFTKKLTNRRLFRIQTKETTK
jgi:hypothetical protein